MISKLVLVPYFVLNRSNYFFFFRINGTFALNCTLTFQENGFICFHESSLKMMKNAFYFTMKGLSVYKIFKFTS